MDVNNAQDGMDINESEDDWNQLDVKECSVYLNGIRAPSVPKDDAQDVDAQDVDTEPTEICYKNLARDLGQ
ncbi:MAG: hypothetical protein Q9174_006759, partial [Haloplaca sp. 1 TL-2023]